MQGRALHSTPASTSRIGTARRRQSIRASVSPASLSGVGVGGARSARVRLSTLSDCKLEVSIYPTFAYNASGGGGWADAEDVGNGVVAVSFDCSQLSIPDLNFRTASLFMVPIPPPLNIAITPRQLSGTIDRLTGVANLTFLAEFVFSAGALYKAPPLMVETLLTTEETRGNFKTARGKRLQGGPVSKTTCTLVGTAVVPKTGDLFMDTFLMLPTDALAVMSAELEFE